MSERGERRKHNSQTVNAAAFGVLGLLGAFAAVTFRSSDVGVWYAILATASACALVASVIVGGRGVDRLEENHNFFEWQARLCLLGFLLGVVSVFVVGPSQEGATQAEVRSLTERMAGVEARLDSARLGQVAADTALRSIQRKLDTLSAALSRP